MAQTRPLKILFVYPSDFLGAVMTVYAQIVRHLDRDRFEAHLAIDRQATGDLLVREGEDAVVARFAFGSGRSARAAARFPTTVAALVRYARREGVDVVHCASTTLASALGFAVARATGVPLVVHVHELLGRYSGGLGRHGAVRRLVTTPVARRAESLVAVSRFIAGELVAAGIPDGRVRVIPNGVDLERFSPTVDGSGIRAEYGFAADVPVALQLGRILASKRQEDFVRALAVARAAGSDVRGLIVGWDDPRYPGSRPELARLARELDVDEALVLADARPDSPRLLAAADVLVSPALEESWGLVAAEAMATGRPVVGARSGATTELVVDGETGFLVEPCDPEALGAALERLAGDADLRVRMGAAGRRRAERELDQALLGARFGALYADLAANARRSAAGSANRKSLR
jgi:glycosyltransferase involved in cell wall biosynthesis